MTRSRISQCGNPRSAPAPRSAVLLFLLLAACDDDGAIRRIPASTPPASATRTATLSAVPAATPTVSPSPAATVDVRALAAQGQAAFYDTLLGTAGRDAEAVEVLDRVTTLDPSDGRSFFLLGMVHLLRMGRAWTNPREPDDFVRREAELARVALDAAVPLLPGDTRISGFRAAATFSSGFAHGDPAAMDLGLRQLRDAIAINFLFNSFAYIGAVAPVVGGDHPLYTEALGYLEEGLRRLNECTPRICGNEGYAAHNVEGTFLLFGDLYAKAGNLERALAFYNFSANSSARSGWPYRPLIEDRLAHASARVALYLDGDPSNDPPIAGNGPEACVFCHAR